MASRKRKFAKYPSCFGKLDCAGLALIALRHGMEVISAYKPDMHVFNEIGLYGTSEQMNAVEAEWLNYGNEPKPRSFRGTFGVNLKVPRERWVSTKLKAGEITITSRVIT